MKNGTKLQRINKICKRLKMFFFKTYTRFQVIPFFRLLRYYVITLLGYYVITLLGYWVIGLLGY